MMHSFSPPPSSRRLGALALVGASALTLAACGGSTPAKPPPSPSQLLTQALTASQHIRSGRFQLSADITLKGVKGLAQKPLTLTLSGPFATSATGQFSTDLTATLGIASSKVKLGLDVVNKKLYLGLGGVFYEIPVGSATSLLGITAGSAPTGGTGLKRASAGTGGGLAALNLHSWLTGLRVVGSTTIGGVSTEHLSAQVDIGLILDDLSKLLTPAGSSGGSGGSSSSANTALALIDSAVTTSQMDLYTGVGDHILRKADYTLAFTVPAIVAGAVGGLTSGSLSLAATLTGVNQAQTISAPAHPQPESKLRSGVAALERELRPLSGLLSTITSSSSGT